MDQRIKRQCRYKCGSYVNRVWVVYHGRNKNDLKSQRQVPSSMAASFAEQHNIAFIETSAMDGAKVELSFYRIINGNQLIYDQIEIY